MHTNFRQFAKLISRRNKERKLCSYAFPTQHTLEYVHRKSWISQLWSTYLVYFSMLQSLAIAGDPKPIETTFGRLSYYSYRLYMRSSSLISLCTCIHASVKFLYFACIPFLLIFSPIDQAVTKHMEKWAKKFRIKV